MIQEGERLCIEFEVVVVVVVGRFGTTLRACDLEKSTSLFDYIASIKPF